MRPDYEESGWRDSSGHAIRLFRLRFASCQECIAYGLPYALDASSDATLKQAIAANAPPVAAASMRIRRARYRKLRRARRASIGSSVPVSTANAQVPRSDDSTSNGYNSL